MGKELVKFFDLAKEKGGVVAQVKLATITKMSSKKAETEPDSPENIKLFEEAFSKI